LQATSARKLRELLILRGLLRPGERLPAERELAERMGVSRPSLREAIADTDSFFPDAIRVIYLCSHTP
jgi:DNA-binding FadR family transcriptional regulator